MVVSQVGFPEADPETVLYVDVSVNDCGRYPHVTVRKAELDQRS